MNSKLSRLQTQIGDIKNIVSTMPPPAPAAGTGAGGLSQQAPPPGMLFENARKDFQAGRYDLAGQEFNEYIRRYGDTDQAADAQFYLGEIFYQQGLQTGDRQQFEQAVS